MPIRHEFRRLYSEGWAELSHWVRFVRAAGKCEACGRPHGSPTYHLEDGRWYDPYRRLCRTPDGTDAPFPDLADLGLGRVKPLWLATAHLDQNPENNAPTNLKALCPICHLEHDRPFHREQFRLTILMRRALGDLFDGPYDRLKLIKPVSAVAVPPRPTVEVPSWSEQRGRGLPAIVPPGHPPGDHKPMLH